MTALHAQNLSKAFGPVQALDQLSLDIPQGAFFGLLGPNGAGKSTFMSIVSGFLKQDSGRIELMGKPLDPNDMEQKSLLGLAPQHIALYPELSAEKNLALFARLHRLSGARLRQQVDYALDVAQLAERRRSLVKEFSGGMKRRLNIAAALIHQPKILLCDEPTVGVDPQSRNAIFDTLLQLKRSGITILYSTHYMEEAERLCDTIAIIDAGKILRVGTLDQLLQELPAANLVRARASALSPAQTEALAQFGDVQPDGHSLDLHAHPSFRLSQLFLWTEEQGLDPRDFQLARPSLEHLFLHLTGRDLRE